MPKVKLVMYDLSSMASMLIVGVIACACLGDVSRCGFSTLSLIHRELIA
jgi:hypothetical protein